MDGRADFREMLERAKIVENKVKAGLRLQGFRPGGAGPGRGECYGWAMMSGEWEGVNAALKEGFFKYAKGLTDEAARRAFDGRTLEEEWERRKQEADRYHEEWDMLQDKSSHLDIVYWRLRDDKTGADLIAGDVKGDTWQVKTHNFFFETGKKDKYGNEDYKGWGLTTRLDKSRLIIVADDRKESGGYDAEYPELWVTKITYLRGYYEAHKDDKGELCRLHTAREPNNDGSHAVGRLIPEERFSQEYGYYHVKAGKNGEGYAPIATWEYKGTEEARFNIPYKMPDFTPEQREAWLSTYHSRA